ncbi:MAG: flagellar basal-body MS-ring/collar protein FliF [Candidatus Zixiibacteriota bacterium]
MEQLKQFLKNIVDYVGRMTPSQVMLLLGITAGTIVGIILVISWLNKVTYSQLYSNLDESEAGEVISYLNENEIPYRLSDGGRTISIPSNEVYQTRISLASEGLPRSGTIGYSIFDQNNLGMTDFLLNLNFRRALEGELTRTIMQLHEVLAARVHIVIPKDRLFEQDRKEATASVVLKLKGGGLTKRQIAGITHLVASSVEGLRPENITIIDYDGNLLSSARQTDLVAGLSSSQLEVRQQVEKYLEQKAQTMLDNVLGHGKSVIRVTAELNFQQLERTSETFDPDFPSIRSEERTQTSNTSSNRTADMNEAQDEESSETVVTNYELNKTVEHIVNAVGTIDRLSIAVLVDGIYTPSENENGETELTYQPRSSEELDRLAALVKNAVGYDPQRNDQLEIFNIAFDRQNIEREKEQLDTMYQRDFYLDIAKKIGYVLLAVVLLFYIKRKSKKVFAALAKIGTPPVTTGSAQVAEESSLEEPAAKRVLPEKRRTRLVDEMQDAAKQQPEEIARVVRTMMIE